MSSTPRCRANSTSGTVPTTAESSRNTHESPCSPTTHACTLRGCTAHSRANASVSRSVSSAVPEPMTATPRSCQRRVRYSVITSSGFVTTIDHAGQLARLHRRRHRVHHRRVLVEDVEPALARLRVVAGGDHEDVLALDLVHRAAAHLDARQQRAGVHEVEGESPGRGAVTAVDRDLARQTAHHERGRRRDPHASDPHDAHRQSSHRRTVARRATVEEWADELRL